MKALIAVLALSLSFAHALGLQDLEGCYHSMQVDGYDVPMPNDPDRQISTIEFKKSTVFYNMSLEREEVILISLLSDSSDYWYSYINYVIPTSDSDIIYVSEDRFAIQVQKDLFMKEYYKMNPVDHYAKVIVERVSKDTLKLNMIFESLERKMFNSNEAIIKKVACN